MFVRFTTLNQFEANEKCISSQWFTDRAKFWEGRNFFFMSSVSEILQFCHLQFKYALVMQQKLISLSSVTKGHYKMQILLKLPSVTFINENCISFSF
jgi:hypothetical protein